MQTNDFSKTEKTVTGVKVKGLVFNHTVNMWLGKVWDEKSYLEDKWTSGMWRPSGKCINRRRAELDLK